MNFQQKIENFIKIKVDKKFDEYIQLDLARRQVKKLFKLFLLYKSFFNSFLKEKNKKNFKKAFIEFGLSTSCNGFPHLFKTERTILKIVWIICILVSTAACVWMVTKSINDYLEFDVITKIETVPDEEITYPAIMICVEKKENYNDIYILSCEFDMKTWRSLGWRSSLTVHLQVYATSPIRGLEFSQQAHSQ